MIIDGSVLDAERFLIQSYQLNKVHIVQWQACKEAGEHVQIDVVLTIEDYQMNLGKLDF